MCMWNQCLPEHTVWRYPHSRGFALPSLFVAYFTAFEWSIWSSSPPPKKKNVAGQQGPWQCKTLRRSSHSSTTRLSPHCSPCQDLCHHSPGSPPSWRRRIALLNPNHEPKPHHSMVDRSMPTSRPVKPGGPWRAPKSWTKKAYIALMSTKSVDKTWWLK